MPRVSDDSLVAIRRLLLALLAIGLSGMLTELVLLKHYEEGWQILPLFLIALSLVVVLAQSISGTRTTLRLMRIMMTLLIVAGVIGVVLHYLGNLEFQVDMDPTLSQWELFKKVIRAKAPPALAPGAMVQLGLLGLIYSYRHPSVLIGRLPQTSGA